MDNQEQEHNEENDVIQDVLDNDIQPSQEDINDFRNKITEYLKLDEQICKLRIAIRERKTLQNALNLYIKDFMFKYNYNDVSIKDQNNNDTKIKARQKEVLIPLKISDIKSKMIDNKNITVEEFLEKYVNNREKITKNTLRKSTQRILPNLSL